MFERKCLEYISGNLFSSFMGYYDVLHQDSERQTSQEILEEYQDADSKRRYHMWFMFRGMREKFDDIEEAQHKDTGSEV